MITEASMLDMIEQTLKHLATDGYLTTNKSKNDNTEKVAWKDNPRTKEEKVAWKDNPRTKEEKIKNLNTEVIIAISTDNITIPTSIKCNEAEYDCENDVLTMYDVLLEDSSVAKKQSFYNLKNQNAIVDIITK